MEPNEILVRQGVDARFLHSTLTKDISPLEAIFDLVDNSIDAARARRLSDEPVHTDRFGLPGDYSGIRIRIRVRATSISLSDNCTGIDQETLANRVFVTGRPSEHRYGIGGFGIGLKRALFRLGSEYAIRTDTGMSAYEMRINRSQFSELQSTFTAARIPSSGSPRTVIRIAELETGVKHELNNMNREELAKHLSRRYGQFIAKGLRVVVNGQRVASFGPGLRHTGPLPIKPQSMRTSNGVDIFIESGMHEEYRLAYEPDYDKTKNAKLTDQYGWYFVCNDRIVKVASHEKELGWTANWHQEYYGFVGWIRFVAEDPENLPWDTKKTQIDPYSVAFREISGKLQEFAESYKNANKKARKGRRHEQPEEQTPSPTNPQPLPASGEVDVPQATSVGAKPKDKQTSVSGRDEADHNENWTMLLPDLEVGLAHPKIRALVFEATRLPVASPYAAAMLFRAIVEFAAFERLKQAGKYPSVCEMYFNEQSKADRALSDAQKKSYRPTFAILLTWLNKNDDFFPVEKRRECVTARNKFANHLKELNGVVHEGDMIDSGKLKIMRNDTLPLLRFLLGN